MYETPLLDLPTGVCTFYMDTTDPRTPAVAIASGSFVYIYKNLRPYFKFTLPHLEVNMIVQDTHMYCTIVEYITLHVNIITDVLVQVYYNVLIFYIVVKFHRSCSLDSSERGTA